VRGRRFPPLGNRVVFRHDLIRAPMISGPTDSSPKGSRSLRPLHLGLLIIWLLTSASSCQIVAADGAGSVAASGAAAGIGLAVFAVGGAIYCIVETEDCFPDKEAQKARAEAARRARAHFIEGLRLDRAGDPAGLPLICLSAQGGDPIGQFYFGSRLLKRDPSRRAEAIAWLRRAAAQGHDLAGVLLLREAVPLTTDAPPPPDDPGFTTAIESVSDPASCGDQRPGLQKSDAKPYAP